MNYDKEKKKLVIKYFQRKDQPKNNSRQNNEATFLSVFAQI